MVSLYSFSKDAIKWLTADQIFVQISDPSIVFSFEPLDTCFKVPPFTAPRRWDITSIDRIY